MQAATPVTAAFTHALRHAASSAATATAAAPTMPTCRHPCPVCAHHSVHTFIHEHIGVPPVVAFLTTFLQACQFDVLEGTFHTPSKPQPLGVALQTVAKTGTSAALGDMPAMTVLHARGRLVPLAPSALVRALPLTLCVGPSALHHNILWCRWLGGSTDGLYI